MTKRGAPANLAQRERGFTLIEVLVAMAILSSAIAGALILMSNQLAAAHDVERRLLAGIVAENRLVEAMADRGTIEVRTETGVSEIGGLDWTWTRVTAETPINGMVRISVDVREEGGEQLIRSVSAFRTVN